MPTPESKPPALDTDASLADCLAPLKAQLEQIGSFVTDRLVPDDAALGEVLGDVTAAHGKMLRPGLVLLAGQSVGTIEALHIELAGVVEMIHTASLLHDDVIDHARQRRTRPTANRLYGNQAAVLLGDFVLSRVFEITVGWPDPEIGRTLGRAAADLCQGELRQNLCRADQTVDEDLYLEIIRRKTAALFRAAAYLGAHVAGGRESVKRGLGEYGRNLGIAFQISDDLLDVIGSEERIGKTVQADLTQQKLTLPWIHFLEHSPAVSAQALFDEVRAGSDPARWIERLQETGSIDYTRGRANTYTEAAIAALEVVPAGDARDRLVSIARAVAARSG